MRYGVLGLVVAGGVVSGEERACQDLQLGVGTFVSKGLTHNP